MNRIIECRLDSTYKEIYTGIWQHDYGQILRITGADLPKAVEVQFSLEDNGGDTLTRIGTTVDGATEVKVPDSLLKNEKCTQNYLIYAWIYVTDDTSGNTEYQIILHVKSRPKPEKPTEEPLPEPNIFHETVEAVNAAADRAEQAEQNAKASATEAGKYATSASKSAVAAEKTKEDALREVGEKKREAIEAIQEQEETSAGKIVNHTDNEIKRIQNQTADSKAGLEQTITNADVSKEELDESIQTASDTKTALDKSTELAGTAKTELDTSTQKAGEAKTALDGSAKTAGEMQETLSATVKQAGTLDTSLGEKIETGTQLNEDITASGEKAVQDIQNAGSEQLGKMQAVAEEFTADREQIATNKEDIGSLKEDLSDKITKFYASNQGETHLADSDNGKIMDMMLYGKSEQKQYKGINLLPPDINYEEYVEVSIPKGSLVFWVTDGIPAKGGNFRFFNEDKTENMWFGVDSGATSVRMPLTIDAKYVQNLITDFDLSKICLGIGSNPIYEPYTGGIPSPSPDYPQEIKRVVNPTMNVRGKNLVDVYGYSANGIPSPKAERVLFNTYGTTLSTTEKTDKLIVHQEIIDGATANSYTSGYFCIGINRKLETGKDYIITFNINVIQNPFSVSTIFVFFNGIEANRAEVIGDKVTVKVSCKEDGERQYVEVKNCGMSMEISNFMITEVGETDDYEPYTEQSVQLSYTLNAIPVASGGNVTIDGQQYIADRVVEKDGVFGIERNIREIHTNTKTMNNSEEYPGWNKVEGVSDVVYYNVNPVGTSRVLTFISNFTQSTLCQNNIKPNNIVFLRRDVIGYSQSELIAKAIDVDMYIRLQDAIFEPLPGDIQAKLRTLVTNYPVTNISVNSEQLDGYTVFNYPISMANGWNYVKKQLNDNRDYIYDMDLQSAEAYVNSEYAVALTELEV